MNNVLAKTRSKYIAKYYNGKALCDITATKLWDDNVQADGFVYTVYKMIDKTNDWVYYGKKKMRSFGELTKYTGSGSLLRYQIKQNGIKNFEFHFIAFFDGLQKADAMEAAIVNTNFLETQNTYNLIPGGKPTFKYARSKFHSKESNYDFCGNPTLVKKICKELGFIKGESKESIIKRKWKETMQKIAVKSKTTNMFKDTKGNVEFIKSSHDDVLNNLIKGYKLQAKKIWMHKLNETQFIRGENFGQVSSYRLEVIVHRLSNGWVIGRPPAFLGADVENRNPKNTNPRRTRVKTELGIVVVPMINTLP